MLLKKKRVSGTVPESISFLFSREKPRALLICFARGLSSDEHYNCLLSSHSCCSGTAE